MDLPGMAAAAIALALGLLAPGLGVARGLVADPLDRLVVGLALGRLLFAAVALLLASTLGSGWILAWTAAGGAVTAAALLARRRSEKGALRAEPMPLPAIVACLAAATLLVGSGVGRSGTLDGGGGLVFYGRDTTNDPIVYASIARQLEAHGLPLVNPFAGGAAAPASLAPYGVLVGLFAHGVGPVDAAFRVVPWVESAGAGLAATALLRALGAPPAALWLAPLLLLLGGEPSRWLGALGALAGRPIAHLDSWAFFGPYLLAFNPIAPALQTFFAALLLLVRSQPGARATALAAGALAGALFELKLFLWAPVLVALVAVAVAWPPAGFARALRLAALTGIAASLPSIVAKAAGAVRAGSADETGFHACLACLPRHLADAAWGSGDLSFALFRSARAESWLDPGRLAEAAVAIALTGIVALGARLLAVPTLLGRAAGGGDAPPGAIAAARVALVAALAGCGLAAVVATPPHHLNAAQFAWVASFGLWPWLALAMARWIAGRRWAALALAAALVLPGSLDALVRLGWQAPLSLRIGADERALAADIEARVRAADVVFEPSMLVSTDRPSPLPLLAGRRVHLSLLSAVMSLPAAERERRFAQLARFYAGADREAALDALRESGAEWVLVPAGVELRFEPGAALEPVATLPAGRLLRRAPADPPPVR